MATQLIDDNGVTNFVDDNGVVCFTDDLMNFTCVVSSSNTKTGKNRGFPHKHQ